MFELPTMTQVAEWQHNNTPIQGQVRILKTMIEEVADSLKEQGIVQPEIYYSIENNN